MIAEQTILGLLILLCILAALMMLRILVKLFDRKRKKPVGKTAIECPVCGYVSLGGSSLNGHEPADHKCNSIRY